MDFNQAILQFSGYLQFEKRFSPHTLTAYVNDIEQCTQFLQHNFEVNTPEEVLATFVRTWMAQLKDEGLSSLTINRKLSALKSFYKYLLKQGVVTSSPLTTLSGPKAGKRLPAYVEQHQLERLWEHEIFPDTWEGKTAMMAIRLLYETGMRRSELIGLTELHTDLHQSSIRVLGKGKKERIIPIRSSLKKLIVDYVEAKRHLPDCDRDQLLVLPNGKPITIQWLYKTVKQYLTVVTTQDKKSPHILRHSFATHLTNAGADLNAVKELLGHSSLAATQVYTHNSIEQLKKVHGQAHPKG